MSDITHYDWPAKQVRERGAMDYVLKLLETERGLTHAIIDRRRGRDTVCSYSYYVSTKWVLRRLEAEGKIIVDKSVIPFIYRHGAAGERSA